MQDLMHFHDSPLATHFQLYRGGLASVAWGMLKGAMSELLPRADWLKVRKRSMCAAHHITWAMHAMPCHGPDAGRRSMWWVLYLKWLSRRLKHPAQHTLL